MPYAVKIKGLRYWRKYHQTHKLRILERKRAARQKAKKRHCAAARRGAFRKCKKCLRSKPLMDFHIGSQWCKPCHHERSRQWGLKHKTRRKNFARNSHLKRKYGITIQDEQAILYVQRRRCAICGLMKQLGLDHCHKTGKLRGYLCLKCNSGIGRFDDSISMLKRATEYLIYHK